MSFDCPLSLRVQVPMMPQMAYADTFINIIETDRIDDFMQVYRYIDIASTKLQGVTIFKNGIKPVTEDIFNADVHRIKFQGKENNSQIFDYLFQQLATGFLAIDGVNGIEMKIKGTSTYYFIWVQQEDHLKVLQDLKTAFNSDNFMVQKPESY